MSALGNEDVSETTPHCSIREIPSPRQELVSIINSSAFLRFMWCPALPWTSGVQHNRRELHKTVHIFDMIRKYLGQVISLYYAEFLTPISKLLVLRAFPRQNI